MRDLSKSVMCLEGEVIKTCGGSRNEKQLAQWGHREYEGREDESGKADPEDLSATVVSSTGQRGLKS